MSLYKIMIVDDEAEVRESIARNIDWQAVGFEVVALAENGQEALEKAESIELDVVLTDIKMPFVDGLELSSQIQILQPSVKIIILTGFDKFEYAKEAIKLNVIEYVLKPINAEELTQLLLKVKKELDEEVARRRDTEALVVNYKKSLPLIKNHFLSELLAGTMPPNEISKQIKSFGIPINEEKHIVVAVFEFDIDDSHTPVLAKELLPISLKQLIDDRLKESCFFATIISFSSIVAITSWEKDPIGDLMNVANMISGESKRIFKTSLTVGIGRSYRDITSIHQSYIQAKRAAEYKLILGTGKVIYIRDMELAEHEPMVFDSACEQRLVTAIKFGTEEQISKLVDSILEDLNSADITQWKYQAYIMGVLCVVSQIANRYNLDENEVLGKGDERFSIISKNYTLEKLRNWLLDTCVRMSGSISEKRISTAKRIIEQAKKFIDENFHDHQLSVDMICKNLHISQSYFSSIFKNETGMNYVQYLTDIRMEKALRLLSETDDKTYMIAQKVGYAEPNYFSYVFKKKFGAPPSQYRK